MEEIVAAICSSPEIFPSSSALSPVPIFVLEPAVFISSRMIPTEAFDIPMLGGTSTTNAATKSKNIKSSAVLLK